MTIKGLTKNSSEESKSSAQDMVQEHEILEIHNIWDIIMLNISLYSPFALIVGVIIPSIISYILGFFVPLATLQIYDRIIPSQGMETLYMLIVIAFGVAISDGLIKYFSGNISTITQARYVLDTQKKLFAKLLGAKMDHLHETSFGTNLETLHSLSKLKFNTTGQFINMILDVPFLLIYIAVIGYFDERLTIVPIFTTLILFIKVRTMLNTIHAQQEEELSMKERKMDLIGNIFHNSAFLKAVNSEEYLLNKYDKVYSKNILTQSKMQEFILEITSFSQMLGVYNNALLLAMGATFVANEELSVGMLTAIIIISGKIMEVLNRFIMNVKQYEMLLILYRRINNISHIEAEDVKASLSIEDFPATADVVFDNVSFKYHQDIEYKNINFVIPFGSIVRIDSSNPSLQRFPLQFLTREITPSDGRVLFNNHNIAHFPIDCYRKKVSYVGRTSQIYQGTIMENLTNFREDVTFAQKEYIKILSKQLGVWEGIMEMKKSFDTYIDANSVITIPKGLKQIFCLIRALVNNPDIILFEEATSSLDLVKDGLVRDIFERITEYSTIILVTHKPSLYTLADKMIVVESNKMYLKDIARRG